MTASWAPGPSTEPKAREAGAIQLPVKHVPVCRRWRSTELAAHLGLSIFCCAASSGLLPPAAARRRGVVRSVPYATPLLLQRAAPPTEMSSLLLLRATMSLFLPHPPAIIGFDLAITDAAGRIQTAA